MNKWLKWVLVLLVIGACYGGYRYYMQKDYEAKQAVLHQFSSEENKKEAIENEKKEELRKKEEEEKKRLAEEKAKAEAEEKLKVKPVPLDNSYVYDPSVDDARILPPINKELVDLFKNLIYEYEIAPLGKSERYHSPGVWRVKVSPLKKDAEYYVFRFFNELPGHYSHEFYDVYSVKRKNEKYIYIDITVEGKTGKVAGYHIHQFDMNKEAGINGKSKTIAKVVY